MEKPVCIKGWNIRTPTGRYNHGCLCHYGPTIFKYCLYFILCHDFYIKILENYLICHRYNLLLFLYLKCVEIYLQSQIIFVCNQQKVLCLR